MNKNPSLDKMHIIEEMNKLTSRLASTSRELHKRNIALEAAKKELEEKEKMLVAQSRFNAMHEIIIMLSHQWRQPLAVVQMKINNILLDLELNSDDKEGFQTQLHSASENIEMLSELIQNFSRGFAYDSTSVATISEHVIDDALEVIHASLENNQITVEKKYTNTASLMLVHKALFQVIVIVLSNAKEVLIRQSIEEAKISIATQEDENWVHIHISDNGGGITDEQIDTVFEPYFSTKEKKNQVGLGLYIAKLMMVDILKGTIAVQNIKDGFCVTLKIPK